MKYKKASKYKVKGAKKVNRYQVLLWRPNPNGSGIICQICRSFRSHGAARKLAEKINRKHCVTTRHLRPTRWVDIHKTGVGCVEEMDAIIVPSVGELGYTP